jgi:hypothetical protein
MVVNIGIKKRGKGVTRLESHILPNIFVGHPYIYLGFFPQLVDTYDECVSK